MSLSVIYSLAVIFINLLRLPYHMGAKAFIEDYKGVVGFEPIQVGGFGHLIKYMLEETDIYHTISALAYELNKLGWTPSNAGNISIRESPNHTGFFITASGSKFESITLEDITYVHKMEVVIGDDTLYIGGNFGTDGELTPSRIIWSLIKQGLFDQVKKDLGVKDFDYIHPRSSKSHSEILRNGRILSDELTLDKCEEHTRCLLNHFIGRAEQSGNVYGIHKGALVQLIKHLVDKEIDIVQAPKKFAPYSYPFEFDYFLNPLFTFMVKKQFDLDDREVELFNDFMLSLANECGQYISLLEETLECIRYPLSPESFLTDKYIEVLAKKHSLTKEQVESLHLAHNCENIPLYDLYQEDIEDQNQRIINAGLDLKTLITYLGKREMIKCKVYYNGVKLPSSETPLHALLYAMRWNYNNINAIVHCHAPEITQYPPKGMPITETPHRIIGYGSLELAVEAWAALQNQMCVLLRGHGPIAVSDSWQRWMPQRKSFLGLQGHKLDPSFRYVFEKPFKILKNKNRQAQIEAIKEKIYSMVLAA